MGGGLATPVWRVYELSLEYLSRVLCLSVCVPHFVTERSAILLVLVIKDGEKREGEIEEEVCDEAFHCLIQTKDKCR